MNIESGIIEIKATIQSFLDEAYYLFSLQFQAVFMSLTFDKVVVSTSSCFVQSNFLQLQQNSSGRNSFLKITEEEFFFKSFHVMKIIHCVVCVACIKKC